MGIWGVELYQNDTSLDVRNQFEELFLKGKNVQEITEQLIEDFKCMMGNSDEESLFWLALADTQWDFGVLLPNVKEQALYWIEEDRSIEKCQITSIITEEQRKKVLAYLRVKLLSSQPPVRKSVRKRLYKCEWNLGDVFAYQLDGDLAKERGFLGRYFLIQKIDEGVWYPGHVVPIVYVKMTRDAKLPSSIEEYNQLEYVQTWFSKYEERFWPIDMSRAQEDIAEKSKINYEVDEYGYLPQYRVELLNTSKKVIPSKLTYVGNFADAVCPEKEFIPHSKENITTVSWEMFETKMIKRYCGHNLRELSIYSCNRN